MRPAEGGGLKTKMGRTSMHAPRTPGGPRQMKQVEPGAETKPDPRTQGRGGFSPNEASVHKGGEKYPPHRKRGGVAKISAYEASILSAILKEPAPTLKGGGVQPNEASVPKGENNRPA